MFQDIGSHRLGNQYEPRPPKADDYVLFYKDDQVILISEGDGPALPQYQQMQQFCPGPVQPDAAQPDSVQPDSVQPDAAQPGPVQPDSVQPDAVQPDAVQLNPGQLDLGQLGLGQLIYLLAVDGQAIYLSWQEAPGLEGAAYHGMVAFRTMGPGWLAFAGATAFHLARWYDANRYCGRCAAPMNHKETERALFCPSCGKIVYPRISPVVMVGIKDGEKLLLVKYAQAHATYRRHALIAGFMEIGETLEDTVRREVMEEVGLRVKNIQYYKSQPWAFSESMLAGFFVDLDGSSEVILEEAELSEAEWIPRSELKKEDSQLSLTWDMIEAFRLGVVK